MISSGETADEVRKESIRMEWEPWLHFAHIAGAVVWVGGGLTLSLVGLRARRSQDIAVIAQFAPTFSFLGLRVFTPAVVIVLLSGIAIVLTDFSGDFTQPWIALALLAFGLAFLIGALYLSRAAIRLERSAEGGDLAAASEALGNWLVGYGVVLVILVFALWDMVFKPGS
jgi:uncharacterized membrane protein